MPPYVSPLREAQAAQTRRRVLTAAAAVFGANGYAGSSLSAIAAAAKVSLETVKQNGPKSALLLASFDQAFAGSEGSGPLHHRDAHELGVPPEPLEGDALLAFQLGWIAEANTRVAALWPRLLDAAAADRDVSARLDELQRNRRLDMLGSIADYRGSGLCRSTRPDEELADELSFLISPEGYTQLVTDSGWSLARYQEWLQRAVRRLILTD